MSYLADVNMSFLSVLTHLYKTLPLDKRHLKENQYEKGY